MYLVQCAELIQFDFNDDCNVPTMELLVGATFWRISRKVVPIFPRLILVNTSISSRLSNEVLFAGFARENTLRTVNLRNFGSQQRMRFWIIFRYFFQNSNFSFEIIFRVNDRMESNLVRHVVR